MRPSLIETDCSLHPMSSEKQDNIQTIVALVSMTLTTAVLTISSAPKVNVNKITSI